LDKAEENLAAARSELISGRYNGSASRAYYACFQVAVFALAQAGIRPRGASGQWGHDFVQAALNGQLINQRKLYSTTLRPILDQNRSLRRIADYTVDHVTELRADRAASRAERFVNGIKAGGGGRT